MYKRQGDYLSAMPLTVRRQKQIYRCARATTSSVSYTHLIPFIKKIPTNLWSFIIALAVLFPAKYFTGGLTLSEAALIPFNCVIIAFASSGGFDTLHKAFPAIFKKSSDENQ